MNGDWLQMNADGNKWMKAYQQRWNNGNGAINEDGWTVDDWMEMNANGR